jgi:DNA-directed RNA polymerase specialized sigma24 family protein
MVDIRRQVVHELVSEYQVCRLAGNDAAAQKVVEKILKRIDRLIEFTIYKLTARNKHLRKIEKRDLYQAGILGFYKAIDTAYDEDKEKLTARIISYIKLGILSTYPSKGLNVATYNDDAVKKALEYTDNSAYNKTETSLILAKVAWMVSAGYLSKLDVDLFLEKHWHDKTYKEIIEKYNISYGCAHSTVKRVQKILYNYFELGVLPNGKRK